MRTSLLRVLSLGAFCALALVVSSHQSFAGAGEDKAKVLIALDDAWSKAAASGDVDRVASYYAEDGVAYPPNEPVAVGRAAAREVWARYLSAPSFQISWKTTAAGIDTNTGWTAGTYEDSFKGPDGKTVNEKGKYVCVWQKGADGKWKAIRDIWNADTK